MDLNGLRHWDRARGVVNLTLLGSPNSFGNILSGRLAESGTAVDGILGQGPGNISIFSQLSSRGIIPKVFSHCLRGDNDGGTLVLGEIQEPGICSPLVPSRYYFTKVKIGSPPREFNLIVDTGSYLTWVSCNPCDGCPTYNNFGIQLIYYDPDSSSSASRISCSTSVVFGCSNFLSGRLAEGYTVDGILGLAPNNISIFSQLSSRGDIPKVFSHCLRRDNDGGTLVLGAIQEPGIIYSPLVPSRPLYNLNLQSIAINGNVVQIDPTVFQSGRGTIVDSGTTLSFLAEMAYYPFIDSLTVVVSRFARSNLIESFQCFQVSDRACSER